MADVSGVTEVRPTANTKQKPVTVGEAVGLAKAIYLSSTGTYMLCDSDAGLDSSIVAGITMNSAASGGRVNMAYDGSILLIGATLGITEIIICSDTPGELKPVTDRALGDYMSLVGISASDEQLDLIMYNSSLMASS